jgi:hypothetical protein
MHSWLVVQKTGCKRPPQIPLLPKAVLPTHSVQDVGYEAPGGSVTRGFPRVELVTVFAMSAPPCHLFAQLARSLRRGGEKFGRTSKETIYAQQTMELHLRACKT